jgi:NhaA family Na+:H+ antiporter
LTHVQGVQVLRLLAKLRLRLPVAPAQLRNRDEFAEFLREETTGGLCLLVATVVALAWANLAAGSYNDVWHIKMGFGPGWLHLDGLTGEDWVAGGLLVIFFYVAGLELKREFVVGELSDRRAAALPVVAALGGMVTPALIYLAVSRGAPGAAHGWAIPVATDIAFALGVLALGGAHVPASVRALLLGLAVVDDLGGIVLIVILFSSGLVVAWFLVAVAGLVLFAYAQRRRWTSPLLYVPLALGVWVAVHACGVNATVAGIALAMLTRVRPDPGEERSPASRLEHRLHPISAGVVVPVFALSAAGVSVAPSALADVVTEPIAQGIVAGLLIGKFAGVLGACWLAVRFGVARLPTGLAWRDMVPVGLLAGIGYTVSLLIATLALPDGESVEHAATAVLVASAAASVMALAVLRGQGRAGPARPARSVEPAPVERESADLECDASRGPVEPTSEAAREAAS